MLFSLVSAVAATALIASSTAQPLASRQSSVSASFYSDATCTKLIMTQALTFDNLCYEVPDGTFGVITSGGDPAFYADYDSCSATTGGTTVPQGACYPVSAYQPFKQVKVIDQSAASGGSQPSGSCKSA